MTAGGNRKEGRRKHHPTMLGWAVRLISVGALLALLAVLIAEIAQPHRATEITVEPQWDKVRTASTGQVLVPALVVNRGTDPIGNLTLEFPRDGGDPAQFAIDLMGESEERTLVVGYDRRPATMRFQILSYEAP